MNKGKGFPAATRDRLRDLSLKRKLILIYIISTVAILSLVSAIITVNEIFSARKVFISDSEGIMRTMGKNSTAALLFHDRTDAEQTLGVLEAFPDVRYAAIMDPSGRVYAEYRREAQSRVPPEDSRPRSGHRFSATEAQFFQEITLYNEHVGSVYLVRDLKRFYVSLYQNVGILLLAVFASLFIGYFLSFHLQKIITHPINELLAMMKTVTEKKQYRVRADVSRKDEIGYLAQGFNEMLLKIEERDAELNAHRQHLEELVRKRTEELVRVNSDLKHQLKERERFEQALRESENRYRVIFENTGNASIIVDEDLTISLANTEFAKLSGYDLDEVIGRMSWTKFVHPDYVGQVTEYHALRMMGRADLPNDYDIKVIDRSGRTREVHLTVGLLPDSQKSIASILDITEWKALEEQLLQSQKMEAVGQLAAGVAHDFNNILTGIIGYGSLLQMTLTDDSAEKTYVDSILQAGHRAAALTQGLLTFGRKQVIAPREIDLNDAIKSTERLLRRMIGEDIELRCMYQAKAINVLADSGQMGQVLMNLAANARDAMPGGGILTIETSIASISKDSAVDTGMKPGSYALFKVTDVGQGMTREIIERIFEPFFTTKGVGQGTGLGLSIVYGIVTQHAGHIHVKSEPGKGTVFSVYLPLIEGAAAEVIEKQATGSTGVTLGTETILLAEDDKTVRGFMSTALKEHGYSVIEASDGQEALKAFEAHKDRIDLLLLDVVMPGMNGKLVYEGAQKLTPGVKAIFMSGYTADILHKKGLREEGVNFISKPVVQHELMKKVRQLLDV